MELSRALSTTSLTLCYILPHYVMGFKWRTVFQHLETYAHQNRINVWSWLQLFLLYHFFASSWRCGRSSVLKTTSDNVLTMTCMQVLYVAFEATADISRRLWIVRLLILMVNQVNVVSNNGSVHYSNDSVITLALYSCNKCAYSYNLLRRCLTCSFGLHLIFKTRCSFVARVNAA